MTTLLILLYILLYSPHDGPFLNKIYGLENNQVSSRGLLENANTQKIKPVVITRSKK